MASLPSLPDNFWDHYTGFRQASPETFRELQLLRGVSKTINDIVDRRLVDECAWKRFFRLEAAEFCDDLPPGTVISPGSQAGNGLRRMLLEGDKTPTGRPFQELLAGCRKFLYDATTQDRVLTEFRRYLNSSPDYDFLAPRIDHIKNASYAAVHAAIINILHVHSNHVRIAQNACAIVCMLLRIRNMSHALTVYTVSTLSVVMQKHPTNAEIHRTSLDTIDKVTYNIERLPFIMAGTHNMLSTALHSLVCFDNDTISCLALDLLDKFSSLLVDREDDHAAMRSFPFEVAEHVILQRMHTHVTKCRIQNSGMTALMRLNEQYPLKMTQCALYPQRIANALMQPNRVLKPKNAIGLVAAIIPKFWCPLSPTAPIESAKTTLVGTVLIPFLVSSMYADYNTPDNKRTCTQLFKVLLRLCQNHRDHTAVAADHQVLQILDTIFCPSPSADTDQEWREHRDAFAALFATPPANTTLEL